MGNRCSPNCKELAEEIEKMHDDSHNLGPGHRPHHCAFYTETMEEMINRECRAMTISNLVYDYFYKHTSLQYEQVIHTCSNNGLPIGFDPFYFLFNSLYLQFFGSLYFVLLIVIIYRKQKIYNTCIRSLIIDSQFTFLWK